MGSQAGFRNQCPKGRVSSNLTGGTYKIEIMICEICEKGKMVLHAFSYGNCEVCKCEITTAHIPCDKVCKNCSEEKSLCEECGSEIK